MSMPRGVPITCKDCGHKQNFTIWHSINVDVNPELRKMVKNQKIFEFKCEKCGGIFNIEYETLYHDSTNEFMIQYFPQDTTEEHLKEFEKSMQNGAMKYFENKRYILRKVFDKNNFIESINIFEHHLNDVLINIMKSIIYSQLTSELKSVTIGIYFMRINVDNLEFLILKEDNTTTGCKLPLSEYESLKKDLTLRDVENFGCVTMSNCINYVIKGL